MGCTSTPAVKGGEKQEEAVKADSSDKPESKAEKPKTETKKPKAEKPKADTSPKPKAEPKAEPKEPSMQLSGADYTFYDELKLIQKEIDKAQVNITKCNSRASRSKGTAQKKYLEWGRKWQRKRDAAEAEKAKVKKAWRDFDLRRAGVIKPEPKTEKKPEPKAEKKEESKEEENLDPDLNPNFQDVTVKKKPSMAALKAKRSTLFKEYEALVKEGGKNSAAAEAKANEWSAADAAVKAAEGK